MNDRYLSTVAAAQYLDLHPETVRQKAKDGEIRCARTDGGHLRFKKSWLDEYLQERTPQTGEVA